MSNQSPAIRLSMMILLLLIGISIPARAQQFTGTIRGTVQDSAGAVIAGAEVSVINKGTNETSTAVTEGNGGYVVPYLKPGLYRVNVKKSGFKTATLDEIKVDVQQIREMDVTLAVGETTETVTVTSSGAGAIETTSSTISQTIENKRIIDLPINGRDPFSLATMSPGVIPAPGSSPFISGGRNATSEVTIDGVSNLNAENNVSILDFNYRPSLEAVQEFSVQTNAVSAEFGRLGGGVINLVTKSGTNQFHATAFEFMRNSALDATNFFTNRAGQEKASFKRNQFGGNFGGPIIKDRTFFFVNYEGLRQRSATVSTFTVPLPQWRQGDFTGLKNANGQDIQLYNPYSTRPDFTRDPFRCDASGNPLPLNPNKTQDQNVGTACNKIPQALISPVARNLVQYWPLPNTTPTNQFTQANNYTAAGVAPADNDRIDARVDHNFNNKWRMFTRFSWSDETNLPFNSFGNDANSSGGDGPTFTKTYSLSMDHTYTFSPTMILDLRLGLNRRYVERRPLSAGFDLASLDLPANVVQTAQAAEFPRINVNGFQSLGQNTFTDLVIAPTTPTFNASATKILSRHTFKFGMDYRKFMLNFLQLFFPSGQYSFSPRWTQLNPNNTSPIAGFGLASLLLGIPDSGNMSHNPTPASASSYWGFYFQDDWRVSRKFTLNLGLRYDIDVPRTERFDRLAYFDFDAPSPIAGQVPANPFFSPASLGGAVAYVTPENRRQTPTDLNNFGPRFGFAYNVTEKTVVRAAYGIYYSASPMQAAGHSGSSGMLGYNSQSDMIVSLDSNRTPATTIDNPFPNGFNLPTGNTLGNLTRLGLGVGAGDGGVFTDYHSPYIQQWNLNIQRELPANIVTEIAYIGSKGTRLQDGEVGVLLNQLHPSVLSLGSDLLTQVPNPFFGIITNPSSPLRTPTVERRRLMRPYPQYDAVTGYRIPHGFSIYHGMTLKADKRFSRGISLLVAYTWSKLIDDVSTTVGFLGQSSDFGSGVTNSKQNIYDRRADRSISTQDITHRFVSNFVLDLPFGKGRKFGKGLHPVANRLIDGWQFNGIVTFQSGLPIIVRQGGPGVNNTFLFSGIQYPTWNGKDANLSGTKDQKIAKWFDTSAFSITPAFTLGNAPRVMPNLRADGEKNFDLSLFKNNYFREGKWNLQFRAEFFNAFNRVRFNQPNVIGQVDNSGFGVITGQGNSPRQIQLALKLIF
jgi:Carboxypeptidase regulatory-like domain/TonB dependent receptor